MTEQGKTILIGAFILIACLAMMGILLFLRPSVGDNEKRLLVCFTSIEKVQIGTRVTFAGKPVGEVMAIKEIYDARSQPTDRAGHVCFYELELAIDSHTVVYDTDEILIHTTGLLGERTIAIIPKAVKKGQPSYPVTDQVLYGKSGDAVDEIINQVNSIGTKANEMMDAVTKMINKNEPDLNAMIKNVSGAANSLKQNLDFAKEINLIGTLKDTGTNVSSASTILSSTLHQVNENGTINNISIVSDNLAQITTTINKKDVLDQTLTNLQVFSEEAAGLRGKVATTFDRINLAIPDINATFKNTKEITCQLNRAIEYGQGTIGKLINSEEFYARLIALLGKADTLMSDINNYGMLFHQNKTWQRERLKRITRMYSLCTPEDFRRYFEEEINKINVSIGRVAQSVRCAEEKNRCHPHFDRQFYNQYSQLLNRLDDVEEVLKLYQQELLIKSCN